MNLFSRCDGDDGDNSPSVPSAVVSRGVCRDAFAIAPATSTCTTISRRKGRQWASETGDDMVWGILEGVTGKQVDGWGEVKVLCVEREI